MPGAPSADELASWVDQLAARASREARLSAYEVRGELLGTRTLRLEGRGGSSTSHGRLDGVSLRGWSRDASAYAFSTDPTPDALDALVGRVARLAVANARRGAGGFGARLGARATATRVSVHGHPAHAGDDEPRELGERALAAAKLAAPSGRLTVMLGHHHRTLVAADSLGSSIATEQLHSTLLVQAIVRVDGRFGEAMALRGGERGLGDYETDGAPETIGTSAAEHALENAAARAAPAGRFRVMTDPHISGLLAHESFGHLTEYDLVAPGWSVLQGRLGAPLADERLTIIDAPVPPDARRNGVSVPVDDEGTRGDAVRLLDRGRLAAFLHQRDTAAADDARPTGNGRALDVRFPPIVRMRNTYFAPGDLSFDEALELLGTGYYLCGGRGGAPHSDGGFTFTSQRAYRVERGAIVEPLKGCSISGGVLDFMPRVEGLTRELDLFTNTFAGCGKWDQSFLHVGIGGPHIVASDVLIGGQSM
jgi:TldD protein